MLLFNSLIKNSSLSSPKYYSHLWNRNDQVVADVIKGDFNIDISDEKLTGFYGNQHVKN